MSSDQDDHNYGNTLAIVSNDPYVSSETIVPIEPYSILAYRLCDYKFWDIDDPYVRDDYMETRLEATHLNDFKNRNK